MSSALSSGNNVLEYSFLLHVSFWLAFFIISFSALVTVVFPSFHLTKHSICTNREQNKLYVFLRSIHVTVSKKAIIEMEIVASLLCFRLELGLHVYCGAEKVTMTLSPSSSSVYSHAQWEIRVWHAHHSTRSFICRLIISNDVYRVCEKLRLKPRVSLIRSRGYADDVMV